MVERWRCESLYLICLCSSRQGDDPEVDNITGITPYHHANTPMKCTSNFTAVYNDNIQIESVIFSYFC